MKKKTIIFVFILVFNTVAFLGSEEIIEEIIAVVNDDIITRSEYENHYVAFTQMLRAQFEGDEFTKQHNLMKKTLLENMIRDLLILQIARERGIDVSEQVKLNIENIKEEASLNSDEQLMRELQKQGINFSEWKRQMEEDLLRRSIIFNEVDRNIVLDDSEIVSYYKLHPEKFTEPPEYKLRAIYLSHEGKNKEELESKKEEVSQKLQTGEKISDLAAQYSEGPEKELQGDLGSFKKGELAKNLEQAVEKLNPGEITPWLETKNGWYLIKLEEKKESRLKAFEEIRKDIEKELFSERKQKKLEEFLKELREKSYVKILNPNPMDL